MTYVPPPAPYARSPAPYAPPRRVLTPITPDSLSSEAKVIHESTGPHFSETMALVNAIRRVREQHGGALRGETRGRLPAVRGEDTDGVDAAARVRSKRLAAEMEKEDSEWFDSPTLL